MGRKVMTHWHVVKGWVGAAQGPRARASIEHTHEVDLERPHVHSGDETTWGQAVGPSMAQAPQPAGMPREQKEPSRLWTPRH